MTNKNIALAIAAAFTVAGCATQPGHNAAMVNAAATLQPTKGNTVTGIVTFAQRGEKVYVTADLTGLTPNAEHGFHVHEKGDCSSGDGMSAGGHFNPASKSHGDYRQGGDRHAGDMPNLKADAQGKASARFEVTGLTVGGGDSDIVGKGVIVHRDPDDYKSQPAGNAGPRLACGVIARS